MWRRMEPTHESSCWPTTTRNDVPTTPHTQSATKKISIYNSTTVSSSRYVSIFCWWHWRTLHLMRAPYFVDDTYGHCIWSESTIWSLDFRISSSRSPHTFCRANQHVVGWLEDSGFSSPPRLKSRCSHLSCVNFSIFRWCTFSGRRRFHSTTRHLWWLRKISRSYMLAHSLEGAHRGRVRVCALIAVSACAYIWALVSVPC